jgi:hypothetical protein
MALLSGLLDMLAAYACYAGGLRWTAMVPGYPGYAGCLCWL